jgi:four helix bundle protein
MARYEHFEDLPAWQAAARLYNLVLDLFEQHSSLFSPGYRGQLDRAALSISNNIAEGFDRITTAELIAFLGYARGSASEVRSMVKVVAPRPGLRPAAEFLREIEKLAGSCTRQLSAWTTQIETGPVQGKRHLTRPQRSQRKVAAAGDAFRRQFLLSLAPSHPLYNTPEARQARGEPPEAPEP